MNKWNRSRNENPQYTQKHIYAGAHTHSHTHTTYSRRKTHRKIERDLIGFFRFQSNRIKTIYICVMCNVHGNTKKIEIKASSAQIKAFISVTRLAVDGIIGLALVHSVSHQPGVRKRAIERASERADARRTKSKKKQATAAVNEFKFVNSTTKTTRKCVG